MPATSVEYPKPWQHIPYEDVQSTFAGTTTITLQALSQRVEKPKRKFRLNWAGGLKEFSDLYTSLELQKRSLDWWGD